MKDTIEFLVFIGFIVVGISFFNTKSYLDKNNLNKNVPLGLVLFGYFLPITIYFICEGGATFLDVVLSIVIVAVYLHLVFQHVRALKSKEDILALSPEMQDTAVSKIRKYLLLLPLGTIVLFVILVLIVSMLEEAAKKKKD